MKSQRVGEGERRKEETHSEICRFVGCKEKLMNRGRGRETDRHTKLRKRQMP